VYISKSLYTVEEPPNPVFRSLNHFLFFTHTIPLLEKEKNIESNKICLCAIVTMSDRADLTIYRLNVLPVLSDNTVVITRKYYIIYIAYPFVSKLTPGSLVGPMEAGKPLHRVSNWSNIYDLVVLMGGALSLTQAAKVGESGFINTSLDFAHALFIVMLFVCFIAMFLRQQGETINPF
jgi:hypothetical protein